MEEIINRIAISLPGFLLAIVCHEAAHAWMANKFGDPTAKFMGRLSLNPMVHYDLFGTIIFPLIGAFFGWSMFGWAKPVPVDSRKFKNVRAGTFWVSFAGPLPNLILMSVSAFLFALLVTKVPEFSLHAVFVEMLRQSIFINIILAVFNLIPLPPLDGSKMVSALLDYNAARKFEELQRYSFLIFMVLFLVPQILNFIISPAIWMGNALVNTFIHLLG